MTPRRPHGTCTRPHYPLWRTGAQITGDRFSNPREPPLAGEKEVSDQVSQVRRIRDEVLAAVWSMLSPVSSFSSLRKVVEKDLESTSAKLLKILSI